MIETIKSLQASLQKLAAVILFVLVGLFACVGCITPFPPQIIVVNENESIQDEIDMPLYNNNVGLSASSISGVGLHYKRFITPNHSVKLVIGGWMATEEYSSNGEITKKSDDTYFSSGLEYHYSIIRMPSYDFYALVGGRTWYSEYTNPQYSNIAREINNINAVGLGLGFEHRLSKHFVINVECGLTYNWELERQWTNPSGKPPQFDRKYLRKVTYAGGLGFGFVF